MVMLYTLGFVVVGSWWEEVIGVTNTTVKDSRVVGLLKPVEVLELGKEGLIHRRFRLGSASPTVVALALDGNLK